MKVVRTKGSADTEPPEFNEKKTVVNMEEFN